MKVNNDSFFDIFFSLHTCPLCRPYVFFLFYVSYFHFYSLSLSLCFFFHILSTMVRAFSSAYVLLFNVFFLVLFSFGLFLGVISGFFVSCCRETGKWIFFCKHLAIFADSAIWAEGQLDPYLGLENLGCYVSWDFFITCNCSFAVMAWYPSLCHLD